MPTSEQHGQVGTVMPQLVAYRCSALAWELLSGWELAVLGSLAETGCSATTSPFSLGHSAVKPALKRVSSLVETPVILYIESDCTSSYSLPPFTRRGKECFPSYFPVWQGSPASQVCTT